MRLKRFKENNVVFAKDQPLYLPLPAYKDIDGKVTFCWSFSWKERFRVLFIGELWHQVLTFNRPLQRQKLTLDKPKLYL